MKNKFIEPLIILAGDDRLRLGPNRETPLVNCRVLSEDNYQILKQGYDKSELVVCTKTLIIVATTKWNYPNPPYLTGGVLDYPTVILFGQDDENPAVEFIGHYEMNSSIKDVESYPELHDSSYDKLMEFAKLKYMEYFDTDDWNITYINQYIDLK